MCIGASAVLGYLFVRTQRICCATAEVQYVTKPGGGEWGGGKGRGAGILISERMAIPSKVNRW